MQIEGRGAEMVDRRSEHGEQGECCQDGAGKLCRDIGYHVARGEPAAGGKTDRDGGVDVATADFAEGADEDHDGEAMRQGNAGHLVRAEDRGGPGADEDQRERADEFSDQ